MPREGIRLGELAERVGGRVVGDAERRLHGVAPLDRAGPRELSFLTNPRYRRQAEATRAGALLVPPGSGIEGRELLEVDEPYPALAELLELFHPPPPRRVGISELACLGQDVEVGEDVAVGPFAVVEDGAHLGDRSTVGPGCVVGAGASVGEETELRARVVLYPGTEVGARCLLHAGVVLGGDGFGFATSGGRHRKVPQLGKVVVESDVEIGANSTVDRATLGRTTVGRGSKLDNLVMVAHGAHIGEGSLLAAQSGISGSTRVGPRSVFAGQAGAAGHLEIAEGTVVAAKSAVLQDVPRTAFVAGIPAVDHRVWKRSQAALRRLPQLLHRLRRLEERLARLEQQDTREG